MDTKLSLISEEELNQIAEEYITALDEMGLPGGAGVGLSLPGGYINGAPKADDVAKVSKKLKNKGMSGYEEIDEETYNKLASTFPQIDFSRLSEFEKEDATIGSQELACVSGACELR